MSAPAAPGRAPAGAVASRARTFVAGTLVVAAAVCALGWHTGLQGVMHGALLSVLVAAFLPFLFVAAGLAVLALTPLVLAVAALAGEGDVLLGEGLEAGAGAIEGGFDVAPAYYELLARQRHPLFWALPSGVLLGGLALAALVGAVIVPGEARTAEILASWQQRLATELDSTGRYPEPTAGGGLPARPSGAPTAAGPAGGGEVLDGFGRPLRYATRGRWALRSYTLRSLGFDGRPGGGDDLCIEDSTRLQRWADAAGALLERAGQGEGPDTSSPWTARLDDVRSLRCAAREP